MAILGLRALGGNTFLYSQGTGGQSAASGIDSNTGNYKIVLSSTANANPSGSAILTVEPGANGNISFTPNGSGSVIATKATIQSGSVDNAPIGANTASTVNATAYFLNGNPISALEAVQVTGATQAMVVGKAYIAARSGSPVAFTLPATATVGQVIGIIGDSFNGGGWTLAQNANQSIALGASTTTIGVGGSLASTVDSDVVLLMCVTAGASTRWTVFNSVGNITIV